MGSSQPSSAVDKTAGATAGVVWAAAGIVVAAAFALYHATLLPGVDFGDTGSFQTTVGSPYLSPRVGYPLYFAIGGAFLRLTDLEPARALNLVTAIEASLGCGLFVIVASELGAPLAAAMAGAAVMAVSYTYWSQAVIAEVYALHLGLILLAIWLLLRWEHRPTLGRLAAFFAVYALAFGNHLSTILLAPAFTIFLLMTAPDGWRSMFRARVIGLATAFAIVGASQYLWNVRTMWFQLHPPASIVEAAQTFWFDVTKADWRDTMVLEVPRSLLTDHLAMYWFDLRQQFGLVCVPLAAAGLAFLWKTGPARGVMLLALYATNVVFAFSYNVGDAHVFYLPSHLIVALMATTGAASLGALVPRGPLVAATALGLYAAARGYRDYPALDRSRDTRPGATLHALTEGIDDQRAILLVDLNWQVANGLSYFAKSIRPELAVARARDVLLYAPALVRDNAAVSRQVVAAGQAAQLLEESFGPLLRNETGLARASLAELAGGIPRGTRYALCIVKQSRDMPIDRADLAAAMRSLGAGALPDALPAFVAIAGVTGAPPTIVALADRPFRRVVAIDGTDVEFRMEAWMTSDTIRRMGFGHVIAAREHTLIVERGVSFATFDEKGSPTRTAYFSGIFALPPRYLIRTAW